LLKDWGALILAVGSLVLGIVNFMRTAAISRAEKRTQLTVELLAAARTARLLSDDFKKLTDRWAAVIDIAPTEKARLAWVDARDGVLASQEKVDTISAELSRHIDSLEGASTRRFTSERVETTRRKLLLLKESADKMRESFREVEQGFETMRSAFLEARKGE
jgi:hypothetical protein